MDSENRKQVLVVGLDGATFEIINPMIKSGRLPNIAHMIKEGVSSSLKSSVPPVTPSAWTSFATGKDPSKHGLYDFKLYDFSLPEGHPRKEREANRTFVKSKSLWRILSDYKKRSIVIDVPFTYPPEAINGLMVSRVYAPRKKDVTYPASFYYSLRRRGFMKNNKIDIVKVHGAGDNGGQEDRKKPRAISRKQLRKKFAKEKIEINFKNLVSGIDRSLELAEWLMVSEAWDFFMVVFMASDYAGHSFWPDRQKVEKIYERLDKAAGRLFSLAGEETVKIIMSDHGFTSAPYIFNINEWLFKKGLLFKKIEIPLKEKIYMRELRRLIKITEKQKPKRLKSERIYTLPSIVYSTELDYSKSKAYLQSRFSYGIRINLEGRDAPGVVSKRDYHSLRNYLIDELKKLKHPLTKKKIFSDVLKKEHVYSKSPCGMDSAPDILLLASGMKTLLVGGLTPRQKVFERTLKKGYGFHHIYGIFCVCGKDIKKTALDSAKITDLMPTVLSALDVPVPNDLDGRVLSEIFKLDSKGARQKVRYSGSSAIEAERESYAKKDELEIKERLAVLGYMG